MKKCLFTLMLFILAIGSFAEHNKHNITTIRTNSPMKIIIKKDSIFNVRSNCKYIDYQIVNDTVLLLKNNRVEDNHTHVVKIKTPNELKVEAARYLTIKR